MKKKKIFIFQELNNLLILLAIFLKLLGQKVYFLKVTKNWRNKKSIDFIETIGLKWLNFQDFKIENAGLITLEGEELQKKIADRLENLNIYNVMRKKLLKMGCHQNDLKSFALSELTEFCKEFSTILKFIDFLKKENEVPCVLFIKYHKFIKEALLEETKNRVKLINFNSFHLLDQLFKFIYKKIKNKLKNIFKQKNKSLNNLESKFNIKNFKTAFFPHQGIFYGNIYKKDYFYSKKSKSNFFPPNIIHFSYGDKHLNGKNTNDFYEKNKIVNIDFKLLGNISTYKLTANILKFAFENSFLLKNNISSTFFFLRLWFLIEKSLARLKELNNLKTVIFGYDILSSRAIAIACRIKKIETIAVQERYLAIWAGNSYFIMDHYLVFNEEVKKFISNKRLDSVKKIKSIGPVRSDLIKKRKNDNKVVDISKIAIFDTHSDIEYYSNGSSWFSNWRVNYNFYIDILKLAKKNPNNKFIIKGKNYNFFDLPYFINIKRAINETSNIELYINKNSNSPYELVDEVDLVIAKYNSLVDELLYRDRSVIIYETGGYPSDTFNYGKDIVVKNFEELYAKFNLWKKNPIDFNKNIINTTNTYFPHLEDSEKVYDKIHEYLETKLNY